MVKIKHVSLRFSGASWNFRREGLLSIQEHEKKTHWMHNSGQFTNPENPEIREMPCDRSALKVSSVTGTNHLTNGTSCSALRYGFFRKNTARQDVSVFINPILAEIIISPTLRFSKSQTMGGLRPRDFPTSRSKWEIFRPWGFRKTWVHEAGSRVHEFEKTPFEGHIRWNDSEKNRNGKTWIFSKITWSKSKITSPGLLLLAIHHNLGLLWEASNIAPQQKNMEGSCQQCNKRNLFFENPHRILKKL